MDKRSNLIRKLRANRAKKAAAKPQVSEYAAGLNAPSDPSRPPLRIPSGWGSVGGGSEKFARPVYGEHRLEGMVGFEHLHPEEKFYLTGIPPKGGISNIAGLSPADLPRPASEDKLASIREAVGASAANRPGYLPTVGELHATARAGEAARGVYTHTDVLSKHLDSPEVHQKFIEDHLTHPIFKQILEEHGSPLAYTWGLFSSIGSPLSKWDQHTKGALALLASWSQHGFRTDEVSMNNTLHDTIHRTYGDAPNETWAGVWSMGTKQKKIKKAMQQVGAALHSYSSGAHDRTLLSADGWKAKNFADSTAPSPYHDPHSVAIDYMMGLYTSPNVVQLANSFNSVMNHVPEKGLPAKKLADRAKHKPLVMHMIDSALQQYYGINEGIEKISKKSDAEKALIPTVPLHGVVQALVSEDARLGDPAYSAHLPYVFGILKDAQSKIWADPALGLAYKMAVTHSANTMPTSPGERKWKPNQIQECSWSLASAILSTRDLAGTTKIKNIVDALTHEAVIYNWDILGTLNDERVQDELIRLGVSARNVEAFRRDCEASVARRRAKFSGPIGRSDNPGLASAASRVQPGQFAGGTEGRKALRELELSGDVRFSDKTRKALPPRPKKLSRMSRIRAIAGGVARLRYARTGASVVGSMAIASSGNALALARLMSKTLTKLGMDPHRVSRAIHSDGGVSSPAAVASVYRPVPPEHAVQGAAWAGLMSKAPGMVAFYADGAGPDSVHRVSERGPVGELSRKLTSAGAISHTIVPTKTGSVGFVYDEGNKLQDKLRRSGIQFSTARGRGAVVGSASPAAGRSAQRDVIRAAGPPMAQPTSTYPPAGVRYSRLRDKIRRVIGRSRMSQPVKMSRWDPSQGVEQDADLDGLAHSVLEDSRDTAPALIMTDRMEEMDHPHAHILRWHYQHGLKAFKNGFSKGAPGRSGYLQTPGGHVRVTLREDRDGAHRWYDEDGNDLERSGADPDEAIDVMDQTFGGRFHLHPVHDARPDLELASKKIERDLGPVGHTLLKHAYDHNSGRNMNMHASLLRGLGLLPARRLAAEEEVNKRMMPNDPDRRGVADASTFPRQIIGRARETGEARLPQSWLEQDFTPNGMAARDFQVENHPDYIDMVHRGLNGLNAYHQSFMEHMKPNS